MGWFTSVPSKISPVTEAKDSGINQTTQLLEDLPPKFEDSEPSHAKQTTYGEAIQSLRFSDISFDKYIQMPCFREAMLTGFQAMGVLGVVTFLIHKNPGRSANWGVCGFFLGNVIGWEQCRSLRRKSFQNVEAAKAANHEKLRKRFQDASGSDESLEKFNAAQAQASDN